MSRLNYLSFIVVCGGLGALLAGTAQSQGGVKNLLFVQPSTPGTQQSGHTNISGTSRAGQFVGGGAGLTGVNAATLGGLPSSAFLQSVPIPLILNGSDPSGILVATNTSTASLATGVKGVATGAAALNYGGWFESTSTGGRGVIGLASSTTGASIGVFGRSDSSAGFAIYGVNTSATGAAISILGSASSPQGISVQGTSTATSGPSIGVKGVSASPDGSGVFGENTSVTGLATGGTFKSSGTGGRGSFSHATSLTGQAIGAFGQSDSVSGIGVTGLATAITGVTVGALGQVSSTQGIGVNGVATSTTGDTTGVSGVSSSSTGKGVAGLVTATSGINYGMFGQTMSSGGAGVAGRASSATGATIGVSGRSDSTTGSGVVGLASATTGANRGVYGISNSPNGSGVFAETTAPGGFALSALGPTGLQGNLYLLANSKIGWENVVPICPVDFQDTLGDKISLWGTSVTSHYGFGVQGSQLQIFSDVAASATSFGYGGSTNFVERARFSGNANLWFLPQGVDSVTNILAPYDVAFSKDTDDDSADEWYRFYTNANVTEQLRILQDDEAASLFDGAVTANGIDFAEGFKVQDPTIEPGDLVINSGNNWEYIALSNQPYQAGVIGVVSTKPAFVAGMSFDAEDNIDPELTKRRDQARREKNEALEKQLTKQMRELVLEKYRPVAFMGRVPVKVVGPVKVGDKLTASNVPGKAMAMNRSGHSIGIALESTAGNDGTIMAMIQPGYVSLETGSTIPELLTKVTNIVSENVRLKDRVEELEARAHEIEDKNAELESKNAELENRLDRIERFLKTNSR